MKSEWCDVEKSDVDAAIAVGELQRGILSCVLRQPRPKPWHVRCPRCNQRLLVQYRTCGDAGCWHPHWSHHRRKVRHSRKLGKKGVV